MSCKHWREQLSEPSLKKLDHLVGAAEPSDLAVFMLMVSFIFTGRMDALQPLPTSKPAFGWLPEAIKPLSVRRPDHLALVGLRSGPGVLW